METLRLRVATISSIRPAKTVSSNAGFSILELLIAVAVLVVGLAGVAALVGQTLGGTEKARYLALATTLASEKLEDLNRYPATTPPVNQITGGGSLTSDTTNTGGYNCFDDVDLSNTNGQVGESYQTSSSTYSTIVHQATGEVDVNPTNTAPVSSGSGTMVFHRRWLIEQDPTVNGVTLTGSRRITVLVSMPSQKDPPITFQMSAVRP